MCTQHIEILSVILYFQKVAHKKEKHEVVTASTMSYILIYNVVIEITGAHTLKVT